MDWCMSYTPISASNEQPFFRWNEIFVTLDLKIVESLRSCLISGSLIRHSRKIANNIRMNTVSRKDCQCHVLRAQSDRVISYSHHELCPMYESLRTFGYDCAWTADKRQLLPHNSCCPRKRRSDDQDGSSTAKRCRVTEGHHSGRLVMKNVKQQNLMVGLYHTSNKSNACVQSYCELSKFQFLLLQRTHHKFPLWWSRWRC